MPWCCPASRSATPRGFTLVECVVVCALVGILSAVALPSYFEHQLRAARIDAVQALVALQTAQERHRLQHGVYASELSALPGVSALTAGGRYTLNLARSASETYVATALATGVQTRDGDCPALTLHVSLGFANTGPSAACWRR
jgi:type IV pilus assembly protein PilE